LDIDKITKRVSGKCVSHVEARDGDDLAIVFVDGSRLLVTRRGQGLALEFGSQDGCHECPAAILPTARQREYLEFIRKYMERRGVSPAEGDIQRHFMVSAPSVHSMVQSLDRQGFIRKQPGVARSIRMVEPSDCAICGGIHHLKIARFAGLSLR
jgi:repressor LexA